MNNNFIDKLIYFLKKYKFYIHFFIVISSIAIGYNILAPFIESDNFINLQNIIKNNQTLNQLINLENIFLDQIITSIKPILLVWSFILIVYKSNLLSVNNINRASSILSIFTSSLHTIILIYGYIILGITLYILKEYGFTKIFIQGAVLSLFIIIIGYYFKYLIAQNTNLKQNNLLDKYAISVAVLFILIALGLHIYELINDPIRLWYILKG